jgi:hypothetical protein
MLICYGKQLLLLVQPPNWEPTVEKIQESYVMSVMMDGRGVRICKIWKFTVTEN